VRIGVLALQGSFAEHSAALVDLGVEPVPVRLPQQIDGLEGLIFPGGESTAIARLIDRWELREPLRWAIRKGLPTYGTCAGLILLAKDLEGGGPSPLGLLDVGVRRNAFGRQLESFEQDIEIDALEGGPFRAIFIRAPVIHWAAEHVRVLARLDGGRIVAAQQQNILVTAFHPELTADRRVHAYFVAMAGGV
jgi:5'-phosphate synthase pdxT subunit